MKIIKIVGLVGLMESPFDGEYLMEYDPCRDGISPWGQPMIAHITTTPNIEEALHFSGLVEAMECWKMVDDRDPVREDGRPNRPLTAFTIVVENYQQKEIKSGR